jgi:glycosyltransferase involved in cell wall biosynthesis
VRAPVVLEIMGEGPHAGHLRERATQLRVADRVIFRPWGSETAVADFLRSLDASILLTRTTGAVKEQFGRVIVESQSCGTPVIGSTCGAIPNVVGDGGWIVPERDPLALANLLDAIAADPDDRRRRSAAAQKNVSTRFTYEIVAQVLADTWLAAAEAAKDRVSAGADTGRMLEA